MVHLKVVGPWMGFEIQDRTKIIMYARVDRALRPYRMIENELMNTCNVLVPVLYTFVITLLPAQQLTKIWTGFLKFWHLYVYMYVKTTEWSVAR